MRAIIRCLLRGVAVIQEQKAALSISLYWQSCTFVAIPKQLLFSKSEEKVKLGKYPERTRIELSEGVARS